MLELEHRFGVVDVGVELDPETGADPEELHREMRQAGVVRATVAPGPRPAGEGYMQANNALARLSVDRPLVPMARLNGPRDPGEGATSRLRNLTASPDDHHTDADDVREYAYGDRFHAFRLDPARDGLPTEAALEVIADAGLPVFVQAGTQFHPETVRDSLLSYDFPVVLSSFGGFPLNRSAMDTTLELLGEYDDLFVDTTAVRYRDVLERGLLEHPDRVLFGSGAPETHPNVGVMEILTLSVSEDLMRRVFVKNPARVLPALAPDSSIG